MIRLDCEQKSEQWLKARLGVVTASCFDQIVTKTGKPSASQARYKAKLIAEWLIGESTDEDLFNSEWMMRGTEMEADARRWYEFEKDCQVEQVGFVMRDDRKVGCSPDGLVAGLSRGVEIKCPSAVNHVANILEPNDAYKQQIQGCLWVCECDEWDRVSFNPVIPSVVRRFERDEKYIALLEEHVLAFVEDLDATKKRLLNEGYAPVGEGDE